MFRRSPESDGRHAPAGRFLTALRLLSVTALLLADREPVSAQTSTVQLAQTHKGASAGDQLGWAVASVGDLDGDGFFDIIVGAPNAGGKGQALVFSGKDGTQLFVAQDNGAGGGPANAAGRSVAGPGDLNSDGTPDVLLGNPQDKASSANDGRVNLISGISHSSLHVWTNPGPGTGGVFGWDVDAGDADLDGTPDILIADPQTGNGDTGRVVAYTGASPFNSVIFSTSSPQADALGWSIAASLDLDGAGTDLIAGAPLYDVPAGPASAGRFATFHVAPPGQQVLGAAGTSAGAMGGTAVAMIDDANGDGKPDIVIGFPGPSADLVRVFDGHINGVNGPLSIAVATGTPGTSFGAALASAGDFDGDGDGDFIVGAPLADVGAADVGAAEIRSGSTGALLATLPVPPGMASAQFGYSVACAGDINGDGLLDYVVGAPFADLNGTNSGAAFVFATVPPPPPPSYDPGHNLLEGRPGAPTIVTLPVVLPIAGPGDDLDLEPVVIVPKTSGTTVVAEVAFAHLSGAYFQSVGEFPCTTGSGGPQQVAGGEFTGDLKPDVLAVNQADDNFSLLAGTNVDASQDPPQGLQLQPVTFPVSPAIGTLIGIRAANLNGDTRTDAVVAGFDGVQPFTQDAPGHFAPGAEVTIQHVTGFAVGNIDTNSADDVVIVSGGTDGTGQATPGSG